MSSRVFISTSTFAQYDESPIELLREQGYAVDLNPHGRKIKSDELCALASDAVGLIAGTENLNDEVFAKLSSLRVISRCGVGMDNVDHDAAAAQKIKVFNTPDAPTLAVAELTIGLMLDCCRQISRSDRDIRANNWKKRMGYLLGGKTIGIIGFGRIGRKVADLVKAFGCQVLCYDPFAEQVEGAQVVELRELLNRSDLITIHCSSAEQILGETELSMMKQSAYLINVARGNNINEDALYSFLRDKRLAGAALDVFSAEPYSGPLAELENVILTSHIGSYARESRIEMELQSVKNLLKGLQC